MCVDMCVHVRLGAGVGVYVCYIGASFPDHRPRVKRSRGQGVMGVTGGLPTRTLTDPSHTMAARQLASCADRAQQGPVLPCLPSPLPSDRHRPSPSANWRTGQPPPASPTLPPTLPQLFPNSLPPAEANRPPGQGQGHGQCANESGSEPGSPTSPTSPGKPGLDSTRLDSTRTRLNPCPCDTLPPPP